ncbi:MAG TPA: T9SS type A sorting domain-containing protein [Ignavibacteriaceae bacterium]|nr:T9SS type A sorting domain-containing protein [Ignavibacteriaceae bacterium]
MDLGAPKKFELTQNFPNPFNPNTAIRFSLPETGNVKLTVFNLLGQEVAVLVNGLTEAGTHIINFDAAGLNSGIYIYRIESGSFNEVRKMTLIK